MRTQLDDREKPIPEPFLIFQMFDHDIGDYSERRDCNEHRLRRPVSVNYSYDGFLGLRLSNLGAIASNLVRVDYQLRLCTWKNHRPDEGFSTDHAAEHTSTISESVKTVSFVPALGFTEIRLPLPDLHPEVINLYFRARACPFDKASKPPEDWDPIFDPLVVDFHQPII